MSSKSLLLSKTRVSLRNSSLCSGSSEHSFSSELDSYINSHLNGVSSDDDEDNADDQSSLNRSIHSNIGSDRGHAQVQCVENNVNVSASFLATDLERNQYFNGKQFRTAKALQPVQDFDDSEPVLQNCHAHPHPYPELEAPSTNQSCGGDFSASTSPLHVPCTALRSPLDLPDTQECPRSENNHALAARSPSEAIALLLGQLRADVSDVCSPLPPDLAAAEHPSSPSASGRSSSTSSPAGRSRCQVRCTARVRGCVRERSTVGVPRGCVTCGCRAHTGSRQGRAQRRHPLAAVLQARSSRPTPPPACARRSRPPCRVCPKSVSRFRPLCVSLPFSFPAPRARPPA